MKTTCPECGTKMVVVGGSVTASPSGFGGGKVELQVECPNADCPGGDPESSASAPAQ